MTLLSLLVQVTNEKVRALMELAQLKQEYRLLKGYDFSIISFLFPHCYPCMRYVIICILPFAHFLHCNSLPITLKYLFVHDLENFFKQPLKYSDLLIFFLFSKHCITKLIELEFHISNKFFEQKLWSLCLHVFIKLSMY